MLVALKNNHEALHNKVVDYFKMLQETDSKMTRYSITGHLIKGTVEVKNGASMAPLNLSQEVLWELMGSYFGRE